MHAIEERIKGGWCSTMYSDGRQLVGELHKDTPVFTFHWNMPVNDNHMMPEHVRHMVYEQRNWFRSHFRLHRSYRWGAWVGKAIRLRYLLPYRQSKRVACWRGGLVAKYVRLCDRSQYLPI